MKVNVTYTCEYTGKVFKTKEAAQASEDIHKHKDILKSEFKLKILKCYTIEELEILISEYLTRSSGVECEAVLSVEYHEQCSNSHSAPKGKEENWHRDPNLPMGYNGYVGTLDIYIEGGYNYVVSKICDIFGWDDNCGIHTGTGGSRDHGLGWVVTIWCDDFPNLEKPKKYENY